MAATASSGRLPTLGSRAVTPSISQLFKVDEGTRRAAALLNAAGQSGVRALLELIVAEEDGVVSRVRCARKSWLA